MDDLPFAPRLRTPRVSADLIGTSPAMQQLRHDIARVAGSDATVLLTGPSGSGKENVARALHAQSRRAQGRFEAVNCGAIPEHLAEAELFGAEAGAFTGATRSRQGRLEMANGGTLFLDEIGDLPLPLQVKLLRVLETREVERLGGQKAVPVDLRIVAATNVDLEDAVAQGRFRADLFWRLAVVWLDLPPLLARIEDIPALVAHFAGLQRQRLHLSESGIAALAAHRWPGNLRELRNLVERALAFGERCLDADTVGHMLAPRRRPVNAWLQADAPPEVSADRAGQPEGLPEERAEPLAPMQLRALLAEAEAALICEALAASDGAVARSARLLGLKRTTLVEKMKRMGLKAANEAA